MLLPWLFVCVGLFAVIAPAGLSSRWMCESYNVEDLTRGWGLYAMTIGVCLAASVHTRIILHLCFLSSIVWHLHIVYRTTTEPHGWTSHHMQSIVSNVLVLGITFLEYPLTRIC
jgi:hypothetical protein